MKLVDSTHCTGCGACIQSCPKKAISYKDDAEGFPTPQIDNDLCVNCGMCEKVCPALHMPETHPIQAAYAAQILDRDALKDSTSGGLFTAFSREIFRRGGVVYGCVWDKNYNAVVRKAENEEEMKPMRSSKYVWSYAADTFPEIKALLEAGRTVLFAGLPCQAAGLKKYLRKNYEQLFILDFLCSGTPSPLAFNKYLDTICRPSARENLHLKFRDKNPYGVGVHITYNGQKKKTAPAGEHITNPYYYSFYSHLIDRRSCYECPYGTDQRISDLTICDYWGIANYHSDMDIKSGVSGLMVGTDKGSALLEAVKDQVQLVPTKKENIGKANNLLLNGQKRSRQVPEIRDVFFETLRTQGWTKAERRYLYTPKRMKMWIKTTKPVRFLAKIKRKILR